MIFSFMDHTYGVISKKSSLNLQSIRSASMLSSRSYIVLCFTFRSMFHFELIFMKDVRKVYVWVHFFCMWWMSTCFTTICWKLSFSPLKCFCSFAKDQLTVFVGDCFWAPYFVLFHWCICLFFYQDHIVLLW